MSIPGILDVFPAPNDRKYPYFTSGDLASSKAVIFIGGLFNGMGDVPYLPALSAALGAIKWKLVQLHWTSAYDGFGTSSLDADVADLAALAARLRATGTRTIVIMGHSTGSQDVIHYLTTRTDADGGIMQAPVSDREHFAVTDDWGAPAWRAALPRAEELVAAGKGDQLLDGEGLGLRITAYRLRSLMSIRGDDDYFSSDLPGTPDGVAAHPHSESFGRLTAPALALFSEKDEFAHIPEPQTVLDKWVAASNGRLTTVILKDANHAVENVDHHLPLCAEVAKWLIKTFE